MRIVMAIFFQLVLIGSWGAALLIHTRRLLRMAAVTVSISDSRLLRQKARRIWWWLGRDEFWQATCTDIARCLEVTLLVVVLAWRL
jgi:hypothetical protein